MNNLCAHGRLSSVTGRGVRGLSIFYLQYTNTWGLWGAGRVKSQPAAAVIDSILASRSLEPELRRFLQRLLKLHLQPTGAGRLLSQNGTGTGTGNRAAPGIPRGSTWRHDARHDASLKARMCSHVNGSLPRICRARGARTWRRPRSRRACSGKPLIRLSPADPLVSSTNLCLQLFWSNYATV